MADSAPKRQACHGSCHCGLTQYIVFLTIPHPYSSANPPLPTGQQEIYRCNCTACQKMGFLHVNPAHPRDDFMLLSPVDPDRELSTYKCSDKKLKYYFCPQCGVRCLTFGGESEIAVVNMTAPGVIDGQRRVWRAKWDGSEDTTPYLSVNGTTIEFGQGFDMRVLTEEKQVQYLDGRSDPADEKEGRWDIPHYGGSY